MGRDGPRLRGRGARAPAPGRSRCAATTTRWWRCRTSSEGAVIEYEVRLDGERGLAAGGRRAPGEHDPHPRGRARGPAGVRLVSRRRARSASRTRCRRVTTSTATASTPCGPTPGGSRPASSLARRAAADRRPGVRRRGVAGDARVHPRRGATPRAARARRSRTSRSTPGSTARRGATPTSAGCCRPCPA